MLILYAKQNKLGSESSVSCLKQGSEMSNFCLKQQGWAVWRPWRQSSTQTSLECPPKDNPTTLPLQTTPYRMQWKGIIKWYNHRNYAGPTIILGIFNGTVQWLALEIRWPYGLTSLAACHSQLNSHWAAKMIKHIPFSFFETLSSIDTWHPAAKPLIQIPFSFFKTSTLTDL